MGDPDAPLFDNELPLSPPPDDDAPVSAEPSDGASAADADEPLPAPSPVEKHPLGVGDISERVAHLEVIMRHALERIGLLEE
jgi:hypothetical protein